MAIGWPVILNEREMIFLELFHFDNRSVDASAEFPEAFAV